MSQVGRISGPLLQANLERNGVDLAFRNDLNTTQLLYLDVNNGKISVNHNTPTREFDVLGTVQSTNLISTTSLNTPGYEITDSTFRVLVGDIYLNASEAIVMANMENGTIRISDNIISTIISNTDVDLTPNGTGTTEIINDLNVFGNIHTPGDITFEGSITLGDNINQDTVTFSSEISSHILPDQDDVYSLGSSVKRWNDFYTNFVNGTTVTSDTLIIGQIHLDTRHGGTLYVSIEGDDNNHGDHYLAPFATIKRALEASEASGNQPVIIRVSPGEYQEALPLVVPPNVSIIGENIRNVIITPDTSSQSEDVFHLQDTNIISNITIKDFYYDSVNNTGYAFRFAPGSVISSRSPYIQNITVLTRETSEGTGDAGRGAWIDGDELAGNTVQKSMLFHSCTFISPGADVINMTNDVRVEWLNSFTYYANRGLYAFAGASGGAELRSIGSANVYGTYGAVADGADTLMYLVQHNFGYIGSGSDNSNNMDLVVQANEVVELNSGQIHYVSTDQQGNFRVGDNFFVDLETGNTSINIDTGDIDALEGLVINSPGGTTNLSGDYIRTGNIRIQDNDITSVIGDLNLNSNTNNTNITSNVNADGNLWIRDDFSFGGQLTLAGDEPSVDRIDFNVTFEQNFKPNLNLTYDLGNVNQQWKNVHLDKAEINNITIDDNYITSDVSNANLEIRVSGTGIIYVPSNNVVVDNDVIVNGLTTYNSDLTINKNLNIISTTTFEGNFESDNVVTYGNIDLQEQAQFEGILFDDNYISTTETNADLELRAADLSAKIILNNNTIIDNNIDIKKSITSQKDVNIANVVQFNSASINDILITENYISSTQTNADLELRANSTGKIVANSAVILDQNLTSNATTRFKDSFISYQYGPELVAGGTFDTNLNDWNQAGGGTATVNLGNLFINAIGSARNVSQSITVEPGKTYLFTGLFVSAVDGAGASDYYIRIVESGVGDLFSQFQVDLDGQTDVELTTSFIPVTNEIDIIFRSENSQVRWDNISVVEDIGLVETIIPLDVNITGSVDITGDTVQTGNITVTGDLDQTGGLVVSNDIDVANFNINDNVLQNVKEDLRLNPTALSGTNSIPGIMDLIISGTVGNIGDYPLTEQNLINFLINNNYDDVNQSGTVTSADRLAWIQYINSGTTGSSSVDNFISAATEVLLEEEFANPGTYNSNIFNGDYFRADFVLKAAGTGKVNFSKGHVNITNSVSAADIYSKDIIIDQDLKLNEIIITDSIIEIDDNFISTTTTNEDLELRAVDGIINVPNNFIANQNLTVNGNTNINGLTVVGNLVQTGTRNQVGDLNVTGNVTVSTSNIESEIQFDDVLFNDNVIETTDSNENLELRANGVGQIILPGNNVLILNDVVLGSMTLDNTNVTNDVSAETFVASNNITLFDNVITTTESNSDLELKSLTKDVRFEDLLIKDSNIRTGVADINLNASNNVIIDATGALQLPTGTTAQRFNRANSLRFNSEDKVFEGYNIANKVISLGGVYSSNRQTSVLAHPTDNTVRLNILSNEVGQVNADGLTIHGLDVDDISIQGSVIKTDTSNSNLDLNANGTGNLVIDDITLSQNKIINNTDSALVIAHKGYGKAKFNTDSAFVLPSGSESERPTIPEVGMMRWNTDEVILETWDGNTFVSAAGNSATISAEEMDDLILEYTLIFG